jgi:hypothetical protein
MRKIHSLIAALSLAGAVGTAAAADEGLLFESIHDYTDHELVAAGELGHDTLPAVIEEGTVDWSEPTLERVEFAVFEPVVREGGVPKALEPTD